MKNYKKCCRRVILIVIFLIRSSLFKQLHDDMLQVSLSSCCFPAFLRVFYMDCHSNGDLWTVFPGLFLGLFANGGGREMSLSALLLYSLTQWPFSASGSLLKTRNQICNHYLTSIVRYNKALTCAPFSLRTLLFSYRFFQNFIEIQIGTVPVAAGLA